MKLVTHYKIESFADEKKVKNWITNEISDSLVYSHRATEYDRSTFPSRLHSHDYYELVIYEDGNINHIFESETYKPKVGDIILIRPGTFHMTMIGCEKTLYKRCVFYLYPDALNHLGCGVLTDFLKTAEKGYAVTTADEHTKNELYNHLKRLDNALNMEDDHYKALANGILIEIFFLLNSQIFTQSKNPFYLPENLVLIKKHIDENFLKLSSASEVASHFFYSREHVSRLFSRYYNTTVSEYIKAKRIAYSRNLMEKGLSISDACYSSGFENMSTFIRAFKSVTDMTPSEYRKNVIKK